jgi:hypothetical protein
MAWIRDGDTGPVRRSAELLDLRRELGETRDHACADGVAESSLHVCNQVIVAHARERAGLDGSARPRRCTLERSVAAHRRKRRSPATHRPGGWHRRDRAPPEHRLVGEDSGERRRDDGSSTGAPGEQRFRAVQRAPLRDRHAEDRFRRDAGHVQCQRVLRTRIANRG